MKTLALIGVIVGLLLAHGCEKVMGSDTLPTPFVEGVAHFEGFSPHPYTCKGGARTIGHGFNMDAHPMLARSYITKEESLMVLRSELAKLHREISYAFPNTNTYQKLALTSFAYNCGMGATRKLMQGRDKWGVANAMGAYVRANGKVLSGLVRRRMWERKLWLCEGE